MWAVRTRWAPCPRQAGKAPRTAESFRQFRSGGNKEPRPRRDHEAEMEAMMAEEARVAKEAMAIRRRMKEEGRRL